MRRLAWNNTVILTCLVSACCLTSEVSSETPAKPTPRVSYRQIVRPYMGGGLEAAITPTPKQASLADRFYKISTVAIVHPADYAHPLTIEKLSQSLRVETLVAGADKWDWPAGVDTVVLVGDPERNSLVARAMEHLEATPRKSKASLSPSKAEKAEMGYEGYVLYSGWYAPRAVNLVILAGNSAAGDFWAAQSLRQMVVTKRDRKKQPLGHYVREGEIIDWPSFEFRGNKRPRLWEYRYKANFGWSFNPGMEKGQWADHFRVHGSWIHHVARLDATDKFIELLVNGGAYTDSKGKERKMAGAKAAYEKGCRLFTLKYDDTGRSTTEGTKAKFGDDYFAAQAHFLTQMHKRLKAMDPENRVYFLPQPYWCNAYDFEEYTAKLREAGGLPGNLGLTFCGIQVTSQQITEQSVKDYRTAFGLTKTKALIYDNLGRGGDFFAIYGRDPSLHQHLSGIFPERGTPFTRITVQDYLWNPEGYDPERSLKLACRELAGADPDGYRKLYDFVSYYNANRDLGEYVPRSQAIAKTKETTRTIVSKLFDVTPHLFASELARECNLHGEILGGVATWGETAAIRRRLDQEESLVRFGYREARVKRVKIAPKIDGKLDDKAWAESGTLTDFVPLAKKPDAPLAGEQQSVFRVLYDDTSLYIGTELRVSQKPELEKYQRWYPDAQKGKPRIYAWRVPCIELFLDPGHTQVEYFQCAINLLSWHFASHCQSYGKEIPGGPRWDSGVRYEVALSDSQATMEIEFPFRSLGSTPRPGDVWGAQFCRNVEGASTWSYMYDFGGFHAVKQFGHLIFE